MPELAAGTLTFVFFDIEGSTRLLRQLRDGYGAVLAQHQRLLREAVSAHGGREVDAQGDSFFAAFRHPREAVLASVAAQRSLARASRLCAAGHGGQVLVSNATAALLEDDESVLPGIELRNLGEHALKDFECAVRVYEVVAPASRARRRRFARRGTRRSGRSHCEPRTPIASAP